MHQGPRALSRTERCRVRTTVVAPVSRLTALARHPHGQFAWATRSPATAQPREAAIAGGSNSRMCGTTDYIRLSRSIRRV